MHRTVIALTLAVSTLTATPSGFFHPLWSYFSSLCGEASATAGPGWDPNGRSLTAPHPSTNAGPGMDPSGRTLITPTPSTNAGPGMDPDGSH
jgi:hypothetical protein